MANDSKTYVVNYDIQARFESAENAIKRVEKFANHLNQVFNNTAETARKVQDVVNTCQSFKPQEIEIKANTSAFTIAMQKLEADVIESANRMHEALSMVFNPGGGSGTIRKKLLEQQIKDTEKAIAKAEGEIQKILGQGGVNKMALGKAKGGREFFEGGVYDQNPENRERYDRQIKAFEKTKKELAKEQKRLESEVKKEAEKGATKGTSIANPQVAQSVVSEIKKASENLTKNLPSIPIKLDIPDSVKLSEQLNTAINAIETPTKFIKIAIDESSATAVKEQIASLAQLSKAQEDLIKKQTERQKQANEQVTNAKTKTAPPIKLPSVTAGLQEEEAALSALKNELNAAEKAKETAERAKMKAVKTFNLNTRGTKEQLEQIKQAKNDAIAAHEASEKKYSEIKARYEDQEAKVKALREGKVSATTVAPLPSKPEAIQAPIVTQAEEGIAKVTAQLTELETKLNNLKKGFEIKVGLVDEVSSKIPKLIEDINQLPKSHEVKVNTVLNHDAVNELKRQLRELGAIAQNSTLQANENIAAKVLGNATPGHAGNTSSTGPPLTAEEQARLQQLRESPQLEKLNKTREAWVKSRKGSAASNKKLEAYQKAIKNFDNIYTEMNELEGRELQSTSLTPLTSEEQVRGAKWQRTIDYLKSRANLSSAQQKRLTATEGKLAALRGIGATGAPAEGGVSESSYSIPIKVSVDKSGALTQINNLITEIKGKRASIWVDVLLEDSTIPTQIAAIQDTVNNTPIRLKTQLEAPKETEEKKKGKGKKGATTETPDAVVAQQKTAEEAKKAKGKTAEETLAQFKGKTIDIPVNVLTEKAQTEFNAFFDANNNKTIKVNVEAITPPAIGTGGVTSATETQTPSGTTSQSSQTPKSHSTPNKTSKTTSTKPSQNSVTALQQKAIDIRNEYKRRAVDLVGHDGKLLEFVTKNHKSFAAASRALGYTPSRYAISSSKAKYLNEAVKQLRREGVSIPSSLLNMQKELNALSDSKRFRGERKLAIKEARTKSGVGAAKYIDMLPTQRVNFLESLMKESNSRHIPIPKNLKKLWESAIGERNQLANSIRDAHEELQRERFKSSIAARQQRVTQMRQNIMDKVLPFAGKDKNLANFIADNYKHFTGAAKNLGFTPTVNMGNTDKVIYLDEVMKSLNAKGIKIPKQIQAAYDQSNKIIRAQELRKEAVNATKILTGTEGKSFTSLSLADRREFLNTLIGEFRERGLGIPKGLGKLQAKTIKDYNAEQLAAQQQAAQQQAAKNTPLSLLGRAQMLAANATGLHTIKDWNEANIGKHLEYYNSIEQTFKANRAQMPEWLQEEMQAVRDKAKVKTDKRLTKIKNTVAPYVNTASMRDLVAENWHAFMRAAVDNNFKGRNIKTMEAFDALSRGEKLQFLKDARKHIVNSGTLSPWALDKEIKDLQAKIEKESASKTPKTPKGAAKKELSLFDRARKWAYPFSGSTSFGANTPMAVDMAKGMGVMFAVGGAMSAIGSSFSQAMEYQNTMETTRAILQHGTDTYSPANFKNMEHIVRDVGIKTKFSAPEVASAARFLAMAGQDIMAINESIRPIADIALIGGTDLGETADKMTNIMTTFDIKPEQMRDVANILTTTATRSNTDLMMLAESAKYGGGVAHMYGSKDPNLFADTMAIFGIMGNAGIQGSSAGTAIRMMYQNIFNPNKNQKAVLKALEDKYKIKTTNADGSFRGMAEFISDVARNVRDEQELAVVVSKLFRITAQPGANAALMAAVGGDANAYEALIKGDKAMGDNLLKVGGLSRLAQLMYANRQSVNGNISGETAEKMQNTLEGLWAQVTSTFTEGVVKALESRQGGFEGMLKDLRDYIARPETVTMIRDLLDLIVSIGKVMADFVAIWAKFYALCPGIIKFWAITQMIFTQFGSLLTPFVSLLGVFNRFSGWFKDIAKSVTVTNAVTTAAEVTTGVAANTATQAIADAANIAGQAQPTSGSGNSGIHTPNNLPNPTVAEAAAAGADIAGNIGAENHSNTPAKKRSWKERTKNSRFARSIASSFKSRSIKLGTTLPALVSTLQGVLISLVESIGWVIGKIGLLLTTPMTWAIGAGAAIGYGLYHLSEVIGGTTEAQLRAFKNTERLADQAHFERVKHSKWFDDFLNDPENPLNKKYGNGMVLGADMTIDDEATRQYEEMMQLRMKLFPELFKDDLTENVSHQRTVMAGEKWKNDMLDNTLSRLALGDNYLERVGSIYNPVRDFPVAMDFRTQHVGIGKSIADATSLDKERARVLQNQRAYDMLYVEGANDPIVKEALDELSKLYAQYLSGKLKKDVYDTELQKLRGKYIPENLDIYQSAAEIGYDAKRLIEISDHTQFREYKQGLKNFLEANFNPNHEGSILAYANSLHALATEKLTEYSETWSNYVNNVLNRSTFITSIEAADKTMKNVELNLRMLPDGKIDQEHVFRQIKSSIEGYENNILAFAKLSASVYQMLVDKGFIKNGSLQGAQEFVAGQIEKNTEIDRKTAEAYFDNVLAKNSDWTKAGLTKSEWADWMSGTLMQQTATMSSIDGSRIFLRDENVQAVLKWAAEHGTTSVMGENYDKAIEEAKKSKKDPSNIAGLDQSPYRTTQTPAEYSTKQINNNIASLIEVHNLNVSPGTTKEEVENIVLPMLTQAVLEMTAEVNNELLPTT